ncbi:MAG: hypothetical protein IJR85_04230 [Synergistaceae bacterium]|nr:hypothetical protein [Synergistaceae bacterium]
MFCIATTGGCGGSSSNSSDESESSNAYMAPLPDSADIETDTESVDIDPTTESGDYGAINYDNFHLPLPNKLNDLAGTKWRINKILVKSVSQNSSRKVTITKRNFDFLYLTIEAQTHWSSEGQSDSFSVMSDKGQFFREPITVDFADEGLTKTAVIILCADDFLKPTDSRSTYNYEASVNRDGVLKEAISIIGEYDDADPVVNSIWITCLLQETDSSNNHYQSWVQLTPWWYY